MQGQKGYEVTKMTMSDYKKTFRHRSGIKTGTAEEIRTMSKEFIDSGSDAWMVNRLESIGPVDTNKKATRVRAIFEYVKHDAKKREDFDLYRMLDLITVSVKGPNVVFARKDRI